MSSTISLRVAMQKELGGMEVPITVESLAQLSDLKWMLQHKTGIPIGYQRLQKGVEELSSAFDTHVLQDLGLQTGDVLVLSILSSKQRVAVDATEKIYQHLKATDALIRSLLHDNQMLRAEIGHLQSRVEDGKRRTRVLERESTRVPAFPTFPVGEHGPQVPVTQGTEEDFMAMLGTTFGPPSTFAASSTFGSLPSTDSTDMDR